MLTLIKIFLFALVHLNIITEAAFFTCSFQELNEPPWTTTSVCKCMFLMQILITTTKKHL